MNDLPFNIYAFVRPTTRAEVRALLAEAIRLAEELDAQIERMCRPAPLN